jgi:hypothetical protein
LHLLTQISQFLLMLSSDYIFLMVLILIIFLIHSFILRKKDTPVELFVEASRSENSGHFETAVVAYESVLNAVKKIGFHRFLENKIIEKLKLLHTIIEYKNSTHFIK